MKKPKLFRRLKATFWKKGKKFMKAPKDKMVRMSKKIRTK